jgi:hypothetical protein
MGDSSHVPGGVLLFGKLKRDDLSREPDTSHGESGLSAASGGLHT